MHGMWPNLVVNFRRVLWKLVRVILAIVAVVVLVRISCVLDGGLNSQGS
jgi:hypothetical protein